MKFNLVLFLILSLLVQSCEWWQEEVWLKKDFNKHEINIDMVFVEGGLFQMGDSIYGGEYEKHVHDVILDDFFIGKYEVTQAEWENVMGSESLDSLTSGLSRICTGCGNCPMFNVDWYDAVSFCNRLSEMLGLRPYYNIHDSIKDPNNQLKADIKKWLVTVNEGATGYRLPTEAEWEYAARGGIKREKEDTFRYAGSNNAGEVAWYIKDSLYCGSPVGEKKSNELGIYDMSGNMYEWCQDWWSGDYYEHSQKSNPTGPGGGSLRILRGGDFRNDTTYLQVFKRNNTSASIKPTYTLGFRVVKNVTN